MRDGTGRDGWTGDIEGSTRGPRGPKKQNSKTLKHSAFESQVGKDLEARRSQLREVKEFHRNEEARLTQVFLFVICYYNSFICFHVITLDSNVPLLACVCYAYIVF